MEKVAEASWQVTRPWRHVMACERYGEVLFDVTMTDELIIKVSRLLAEFLVRLLFFFFF